MKGSRPAPDDLSADTNVTDEGGRIDQADELADRAKAAGAVGRNGSDRTRALRDSAILARAACGAPASEIAEEFELSPRTVRRIVRQSARLRSPLDERPMDLIERSARLLRRMFADAQLMAFEYSQWNPSAAIGAKKLALEALDRELQLLTDLGKLPEDLALVRDEAELVRIGRLMIDKLGELANGQATAEDCIELFDRLIGLEAPLEEDG